MKNCVNTILHRQLVDPLEEYLRDFRPQLRRGTDLETLIVTKFGNPDAVPGFHGQQAVEKRMKAPLST